MLALPSDYKSMHCYSMPRLVSIRGPCEQLNESKDGAFFTRMNSCKKYK